MLLGAGACQLAWPQTEGDYLGEYCWLLELDEDGGNDEQIELFLGVTYSGGVNYTLQGYGIDDDDEPRLYLGTAAVLGDELMVNLFSVRETDEEDEGGERAWTSSLVADLSPRTLNGEVQQIESEASPPGTSTTYYSEGSMERIRCR